MADKKTVNTKKAKEEENKIKALNRSLGEREINKLIQNMDKSRSSRNKTDFPKKNKSESNLPKIEGKKVSVNQKEGKGNKSPKKGNNKSRSPTSANKGKKPTGKSTGKSPSPQKKSNIKKKK